MPNFTVLVCGSRDFVGRKLLRDVLDTLHATYTFTHLIHGNARGADILAHYWAVDNKIHVHPYKAEWNKYGRAAGLLRNTRMLEEGKPNLVVAFTSKPLRESIGTANMVQLARAAKVETLVYEQENYFEYYYDEQHYTNDPSYNWRKPKGTSR